MAKIFSKKINVYAIIIGIFLLAYTISIIFPLLWGVMTSFKEKSSWGIPGTYLSFPDLAYWELNRAAYDSGNPAFVSQYANYTNIFGNYLRLFADLRIEGASAVYRYGWNLNKSARIPINQDFWDFLINTILYAGGTALCGALAPCIMGYMCSKYKYKFCGYIYAFVVFVMVMPIVGNTSAVLTLTKRLSMHDTIWGMWIRGANFANMYFLVFFAFFKGVPDTYAEAAQLDGSSYFRVMWTIYIPLSIKMISTIFLIQFVTLYNDYGVSLVYLPSHLTLAYAVWYFGSGIAGTMDSVPFNIAACMVLALPMIIFFAVFKNKLMGNMSLGGLKE